MFKRLRYYFIAVLCIANMTAVSAQTSWPMFRGNVQQTGYTPANITPPLRVVWSRNIGATESTPAIVNGIVYCAGLTGKVTAMNLSNGKVRWIFKSPSSFGASPTIYKGIVYIGDEGGVFYAIRAADGKELWRFRTGDKIMSCAVPAGGGRILFGSYDMHLYCLQSGLGKKRWSFKTQAQVHATASVVGNQAVISGCDGKIRFLSLQNGNQTAVVPFGGNIAASPAYSNGHFYLGGLNAIYASIDVKSHAYSWKMQEHEDGAACYASAAATKDGVVFGSRSNKVFRVNPANGKPVWSYRCQGQINASPVINNKIVWVASDDGILTALDYPTGRMIWQFRAGGSLKGSPAIVNNRLVIGSSDGMLYCLGN